MPRAPSELTFLPEARDDLQSVQEHNPDHAERILKKIEEWQEHIQWGRVPQEHLKAISGSSRYNFYRQYVGKSGYRVVYEISNDEMLVVGIRPKGDRTYDLEEFHRRVDHFRS